MNFGTQKKEGYTVIQVHNERLDSLIAPDLKSELVLATENGQKNIVLDISECTYCDSSGLSALLVGNRLCENASGQFVLCGLTPMVDKLIKLAMLDTVLTITIDEKEASKLLNKDA